MKKKTGKLPLNVSVEEKPVAPAIPELLVTPAPAEVMEGIIRQKWDYRFLKAIGGDANWEPQFDALGAEGFEFCGTDSRGRSVFKRPVAG